MTSNTQLHRFLPTVLTELYIYIPSPKIPTASHPKVLASLMAIGLLASPLSISSLRNDHSIILHAPAKWYVWLQL
jgi:hypothetical protein